MKSSYSLGFVRLVDQAILSEIIHTVHGHTFAVELAARLLEVGILEPDQLLEKLRTEKAAMDSKDKVSAKKDGKSKKATYYTHIHAPTVIRATNIPHITNSFICFFRIKIHFLYILKAIPHRDCGEDMPSIFVKSYRNLTVVLSHIKKFLCKMTKKSKRI